MNSTKQIWLRRDRQDGSITEVDQDRVKTILHTAYHNVRLAMEAATEDAPATNGMADYWPKPEAVK